MTRPYKPRQMPARFLEGAPPEVQLLVLDIMRPKHSILEFDVIFDLPYREEWPGLDFGDRGERGEHFFLDRGNLADWRDFYRHRRVKWADLPAATQAAIVAYLNEGMNR